MNKTVNPEFVESFLIEQNSNSTRKPSAQNNEKFQVVQLPKNIHELPCDESIMVAPPKNYQPGGGGGIVGLENNRPEPLIINDRNALLAQKYYSNDTQNIGHNFFSNDTRNDQDTSKPIFD